MENNKIEIADDLEKLRNEIRDVRIKLNNIVLDVIDINQAIGYNFNKAKKDIDAMRFYTGIGYFTLGFALAVMLRIRGGN